jgi:hypothetical protein
MVSSDLRLHPGWGRSCPPAVQDGRHPPSSHPLRRPAAANEGGRPARREIHGTKANHRLDSVASAEVSKSDDNWLVTCLSSVAWVGGPSLVIRRKSRLSFESNLRRDMAVAWELADLSAARIAVWGKYCLRPYFRSVMAAASGLL